MDLIEYAPEILLPNTKIHSFFGVFPGTIWNGGSAILNGSIQREKVVRLVEFYNYVFNYPLTFTFTNTLLEEKHYYDTYSNMIAEVANNGKNYILVADEKFEKYLRDTYPNYTFIRSVIAAENEPYSLSSPYGSYEISVIRRNKNNDWDYLNQIPLEDRAHLEFVCNDQCPDNCPRLYTHYKDLAKSQLLLSEKVEGWNCSLTHIKGMFPQKYVHEECKTYISREMIDKQYLPNGFNKFKLVGRIDYGLCILNILNYLIKPEYRDDIFLKLFNSLPMN